MRFIGVHIGHDAGVAVFDENGQVIFYGQCERYSRFKNHGFEIDPIGMAFPDMPTPDEDDVIAVVACEQPGNPDWRGTINISHEELDYCSPNLVRPYKPLAKDNLFCKSIGKNPHFYINHHLAHTLSAWCFRPNGDERLFMSYDGAGCDSLGSLRCYVVGTISDTGFSEIEDATPIPTSLPVVGLLGYNSAGKSMGLAGYMPKQDLQPAQFVKVLQYSLNEMYQPRYPFFPPQDQTDENLQIVANFYRWYMNETWATLEDNIRRFGAGKGVVISGGTSLALEINTKLWELTRDVVFGPPTDDSGLALGAAAFAYYHVKREWPKLTTPALNALQDPLPEFGPQEPGDIARLLASDRVIGLLRGNSETGPRALGFRSIFASATEPNLKRVSQQIKGREFFRPLAPVVTAEAFDKLFAGPKGEYMQFMVSCREEAQRMCPAICHKDLSARPQVVYRERDPWLHELLVEYGRLSGVECIINTSLNKNRKPICNTWEDARREMRGKDLELVSLPHPRWRLAVPGQLI